MEKTDGVLKHIYVWGNGVEALIVPTDTGRTIYGYLKNAHGDVLSVGIGTFLYAEYDYDAYGNVVSCTENGIENPIRYAGYYYDTDTDNYYLKNRYYSPYQGRFLTEDPYLNIAVGKFTSNIIQNVYYPAFIQSGNKYTYCMNNPITYSDPLGYWVAGDELLNQDAQLRIIALTSAYYQATTDVERNTIEAEANAIRNDPESKNLRNTLLKYEGSFEFRGEMDSALSNDGIVTPDELNHALTKTNIAISHNQLNTAGIHGSDIHTTTATAGHGNIYIKSDNRVHGKATHSSTVSINAETHYDAYVFYLNDWSSESQNIKYDLAKALNIDVSNIGTASVYTNKQFNNDWNMITGDVQAMVVNTHGDPSGIGGESMWLSSSEISQMNAKNIGNLILLGCNVGHLNYIPTNPAAAFLGIINGGNVMASDGTVLGKKSIFESQGDKSYFAWQDGFAISTRPNNGWVIYSQTSDGQ